MGNDHEVFFFPWTENGAEITLGFSSLAKFQGPLLNFQKVRVISGNFRHLLAISLGTTSRITQA